MRRRLPIIRWRPKPEKKPKPDPERRPDIGSGWVPGVSDGSWLLPDWTREPLEKVEDAEGRVLWRPRRD